jgi:Bacteriophage minor capsid protein
VILEALGDYLQTNSIGTLGTNIFLGKMPASPDYCITLYEYEGMAPDETFGSAAYNIDKPRIQVVVRGARDDYPTARNGAKTIKDLLSALTDVTISSTKVLRVASLGAFIPLGLDDKDRPRIAANFQAYVER